jgi:uncharacterized membrane protein YbhN (UPF0104 family)
MMKPTRLSVLVIIAILTGAVAYLVTRSSYDDLPTPTVYALLWLALLAIAEFYVALVTRARLAGRPGTRPINPLVVARFVALAKASSIVGSLAAGGYAGFLIWVVRLSSPASTTDTRTASFGVGFAILLVMAALFLERVCRVPTRDDEDDWPPEVAE